jgi:hypothetical protein
MASTLAGELGTYSSMSRHANLIRNRRHSDDLDYTKILIPTFKHWYAYQIVYPWALFFVKASILALYHRIFTQAKFRRAVYFVAGFVTVQIIVVTFVNVGEPGIKHLSSPMLTFQRPSNAAQSLGGHGDRIFLKDATACQ